MSYAHVPDEIKGSGRIQFWDDSDDCFKTKAKRPEVEKSLLGIPAKWRAKDCDGPLSMFLILIWSADFRQGSGYETASVRFMTNFMLL